jgi:hypothetical protein
MFKRRTTNSRQKSRMKRLEVRVMSPRIAWFGFLRVCGKAVKLCILLGLIGGAGWGGWLGIQKVFLKNPEFQLQRLLLNPNQALDEPALVEAGGIDLRANLFSLDLEAIRQRLVSRPEIAAAKVERHLPSTLAVTLEVRTPRAWIALKSEDLSNERRVGGLLVDGFGIVYPCPELQWDEAKELPMMVIPAAMAGQLIAGQPFDHPELQRCMRLLDTAIAAAPEATQWIDRLEQVNAWSVLLTTRHGTVATFGFENQTRQMGDFMLALDHASREGYAIATISLIPQRNIPITLREEPVPPRAVVVQEPTREEVRSDRRSKDLKSLIQRN